MYALCIACRCGQAVCAQLLIDRNADVNNHEVYDNESVLHIAASVGKLKCVELLVQNGADVNAQDDGGWTALS
jgi:ankyrin repeat protein